MTPKRAQLGNGPSGNPFRASEHRFKAWKWYTSNQGGAIICITAKYLNFHLKQGENLSWHVLPCKRGGWSHPTAIKIQLFLPGAHLLRHATSALQQEVLLQWQLATYCRYGWKLDDNLNLSMECWALDRPALYCAIQCWAALIRTSLVQLGRCCSLLPWWWSVCGMEAMIWQSQDPPNSTIVDYTHLSQAPPDPQSSLFRNF